MTSDLFAIRQQVHSSVKLPVLHEEVGAPLQKLWVCLIVQILRNQLQSGKLLGVKCQVQRFGEVSSLKWVGNKLVNTYIVFVILIVIWVDILINCP